MKKWKPTYIFTHYTDITPAWCTEQKIKFILSDLDGTLAGWNEGPDETFMNWYRSIEAVGVGLIIVSNNHQARIQPFTDACSLVGYANCNKPSHKKIEREVVQRGLNLETSLFLGDQLFTDVWCGQKLGIRTATVEPLGDYEPFRTSCKRWLERLVKKTWRNEE